MQDNYPKHTSQLAQEFFQTMGINWQKTPPESPDANPIENLWHELKNTGIYKERGKGRSCKGNIAGLGNS